MNANIELEELARLRDHYITMSNTMRDMIKQLNGYTPKDAALTFSIGPLSVVKIPIDTDNANFCMGFFISWYTFYSNKLKDITATYNAMAVRVA